MKRWNELVKNLRNKNAFNLINKDFFCYDVTERYFYCNSCMALWDMNLFYWRSFGLMFHFVWLMKFISQLDLLLMLRYFLRDYWKLYHNKYLGRISFFVSFSMVSTSLFSLLSIFSCWNNSNTFWWLSFCCFHSTCLRCKLSFELKDVLMIIKLIIQYHSISICSEHMLLVFLFVGLLLDTGGTVFQYFSGFEFLVFHSFYMSILINVYLVKVLSYRN